MSSYTMKKFILSLVSGSLLILNLNAQQTVEPTIKKMLLQQGLTESDVAQLVITDQYTSKHNGVTHVYFRQQYNGIEVFNGVGSAHFKNGEAVAVNQRFVANIATKVEAAKPAISVNTAVQQTASFMQVKAPTTLSKSALELTNNRTEILDATISSKPVKVQLYYFITDDNKVKLVYNTNWLDDKSGNWWNVRVDALTGNVVDQNNWSLSCGNHNHAQQGAFITQHQQQTQRVTKTNKKANNARGVYRAFPLGVESPIHGNRELLDDPADSIASPYGWHDTDGVEGAEYTITAGNNVFASEDINNLNEPGYSPDGGDSLVFDYDYDMAGSDRANLNAAITNLFVWNNFMHDVMYHYGFDELSGNFQSNNFGKGGEQGDYVFADAQDGSGTNNANFATPPDGENPRMQMYLWSNGTTAASTYLQLSDSSLTDSALFVTAAFGPKRFSFNNMELVLGVSTTSGNSLACDEMQDLTGKAVLIDRGTCNFPQKVRNAQAASAAFVIVANNVTSAPYAMTGGSGTSDIFTPSVMVSKATGDALKQRLAAGKVTITINTDKELFGYYDSDLDNGVIAHEFGHGISNRLTGGPSNTSCLTNMEQAGEGWSDFFCLVLTQRATDSANVPRGIGTWLSFEPTTGLGIRNYRYSRDLSINPLTYNSIKTLAVPHGVGSVWCTMLYDLYWNLVDKYGYDPDLYYGKGGNNRALQLVMDGLKLQPCSPGFVDARNAILLADRLNNNGADSSIIWSTFARRGLGYSASQGSTSSRSDGVEAKDLPPSPSSGLNDLNKNSGMAFWPNPGNGQFEIRLPEAANAVKVEIYDVTGSLVFSRDLTGSDVVPVDASSLPKGIYLLKAESKGRIFTSKLMIAE